MPKAKKKTKKPDWGATVKQKSKVWGKRVVTMNLPPGQYLPTKQVRKNSTMYWRLQKRKGRVSPLTQTADLFTLACRLKVCVSTPKGAYEKKIFKSVHCVRGKECDDDLHCRICRATTRDFCFCPVSSQPPAKLPEVNLEHLRSFFAFVKSESNPLLHFCEPTDQAAFRNLLVTLGSHSITELCRILFTVSMISNEVVFLDTSAEAKEEDFECLDSMFAHWKQQGFVSYGGGQRAGRIGVDELLGALQKFCDQALGVLAPYFDKWRKARRRRTYCVKTLRGILTCLSNLELSGFGDVEKKRFAECLVMAAFGRVYNLYFKEEWLNDLADLWPLPNTALANLKLIFPGLPKIRNEKQSHRACIVALLRALRKGSCYTFPCIVVQLCWWSEQRNGRLDWM